MTPARVIGRDGGLPWRLPADLAHFKRLTLGRPVVMGRKVYDSIGRPLPGRQNIVLSRNGAFQAPGCDVVRSPGEALDVAADAPQVAIIGGAEVYALFMPQLTRIELTLVHADIEGDTFMPDFGEGWTVVEERQRPADEKNAHAMTFQTLRRHIQL